MKVCWNLSSSCNKTCSYCFRELFENSRNLEELKTIASNLKHANFHRLTFSGGEPFLFKNIIDLIKYCKEINFENFIITNGSVLNKDNIEEYLKYLDKITFSIDSPSEYVNYETGRGYDSYTHIKKILPIIREFYPTLPIEINSVITKESIDEVDYLFDAISNELYEYGINKWKIIRFYPLRGYAKERKEFYDLTDEEFKKIEDKYTKNYTTLFEVETRDIKTMDDDLIISPCGSLKKSFKGMEYVLINDMRNTTPFEIISSIEEFEMNKNIKTLSLGGHHV